MHREIAAASCPADGDAVCVDLASQPCREQTLIAAAIEDVHGRTRIERNKAAIGGLDEDVAAAAEGDSKIGGENLAGRSGRKQARGDRRRHPS